MIGDDLSAASAHDRPDANLQQSHCGISPEVEPYRCVGRWLCVYCGPDTGAVCSGVGD